MMSLKKAVILVVDDDPRIVRLLANRLQMEGYQVSSASHGLQALGMLADVAPDLILLDLMMPYMDGFEFCEQVRTFSTTPIIILTALGRDDDKVRGLDLGADDYLVKPFSLEEMLARVRVALRHSQTPSFDTGGKKPPVLHIADLVIDYEQHRVTREEKEVPLTPIEFGILGLLTQYAGRVLTQDFILEHVWGKGYTGESHMLQISINRLRRKIEVTPSQPHYILTKVGVGYYFAIPAVSGGLVSLMKTASNA
jgi:DNA-binding response OmpR family regulator